MLKSDVKRDDLQQRFSAQHGVAMFKQCCNHSKQCRNNAVVLFCAENRRCKSSRVTSPTLPATARKRKEKNQIMPN